MILHQLFPKECVAKRMFSITIEHRAVHRIRRIKTVKQHNCRFFVSNQKSRCFITTPIFYVNASPHIGHCYTVLLADVYSRWNKLKGKDILFSTGTDEHGLKIQQSAAKVEQHPGVFCDNISQRFRDLFNSTNISYTDFIRTTEKRHQNAVETFWNKLESKGYIYKGVYEGWYSVSDEEFLSEAEVTDVVIDGQLCKVSVASEQPVTWMKEDNYMFRLSEFKHKISDWLDTGVIKPKNFDPVVRHMLKDVKDLSISRQSDRLSWGIPVSTDPTQTIYVWLDALVNYLTVAGYPDDILSWPPDYQVIGKDILRFHAVYWPAFLMAADLELPKALLCHSHWTVDNSKMSKSRGNVVNPMDRMKKYSVDGLRYFLLRVGVPHLDGNYVDLKAIECINSELVNTLGNLLSRCTSVTINRSQVFPACRKCDIERHLQPADREKFYSLQNLPDIVDGFYKEFSIYKALDTIVSHLHWSNRFVDHHEPWKLVKCEHSLDHLHVILHVTMVTLRNCGILLQPIIPDIANKLLNRLNVPKSCRTYDHAKDLTTEMETIPLGKDNSVLLSRLKI